MLNILRRLVRRDHVNPYTGFQAAGGIQRADKATGAIFGEDGPEWGVFLRNPVTGPASPTVRLFLHSRRLHVKRRRRPNK